MRAARSTAPAYLVVGINWKSTASDYASTAIARPRQRSGRPDLGTTSPRIGVLSQQHAVGWV